MLRILGALWIISFAIANTLSGQVLPTSAERAVGERVRLRGDFAGSSVTGRLVLITTDSVYVRTSGVDTVSLAKADIRQAERRAGTSAGGAAVDRFGVGALVGGTVLAATVLLGAEYCIVPDVSCWSNDLEGASAAFLVGGLLGGFFGALFGPETESEVWVPIVGLGVG